MAPFTQGLQITFEVRPASEQWFYVIQLKGFIQQAFAGGTAPFLVCRHTLLDQGSDVGAPRWKPRSFGYDWGRRRLFLGLEKVLAMLQDTERCTRAPFAHGQNNQ